MALEPLTSSHCIDLLVLPSLAVLIPQHMIEESVLQGRLGMKRVDWTQYTAMVGVRGEMESTAAGQLFVSSSSLSASFLPISCCCVVRSTQGGQRCRLRLFALSISQAAMFVSRLQSVLSSYALDLVIDTANAGDVGAAENLLSSLSRETERMVRSSARCRRVLCAMKVTALSQR